MRQVVCPFIVLKQAQPLLFFNANEISSKKKIKFFLPFSLCSSLASHAGEHDGNFDGSVSILRQVQGFFSKLHLSITDRFQAHHHKWVSVIRACVSFYVCSAYSVRRMTCDVCSLLRLNKELISTSRTC